jgi:hypothetical protein
VRLPVRYRIPASMVRYAIFTALVVLVPVCLAVIGTGLPTWAEAVIVGGTVALLAAVILRLLRLGTVISADGVTRRGFLGDRRYGWSDIEDVELRDNRVAHAVGPFIVTPRFLVVITERGRRGRKTLLFLDERAFTSLRSFETDLNEVVRLRHERRAR